MLRERNHNLNRIKIKIIATLYVGFGIIDLITRFLMKFCFRAEGGMYPLLLWNPIRLVPVNIFLFGLTVYSTIKILHLDFSNALKCGIIITLLGALSFYLDTNFILSFDYISPNIGYYLEIISLIFFVISLVILLYCVKFSNTQSFVNQT